MDPESLSPESRRQIDNEFDSAFDRTRSMAAVLLRCGKRVLIVVAVLLVIAFVADYVEVRRNPEPLGSVEIKRYYAVGLKNGKTEMMYADPENQTCVNSVFPHSGYSPCWYVRRHAVKQIDL